MYRKSSCCSFERLSPSPTAVVASSEHPLTVAYEVSVKGLQFRRAIAADASPLTALAHASKRYWGYSESLIELWQDDLTFTPTLIANWDVHLAEAGGSVLGVFALSIQSPQAELEDLWVHPDSIGQGLGRELFSRAVAIAKSAGAEYMVIISDPNAEGFYRHMGAERIGVVSSIPKDRKLPKLQLRLGS